MVCYGIKGLHTDIPLSVYDAIWGFDNGKVTFNETIDMNGKDITGVNKMDVKDLDVNNQIDMKSKKIIGVGDGITKSDAVNKGQLEGVETQVTSQITTVNNKVTQNKTEIETINNHNGYFAFTDQLKHDNEPIVKFPPNNTQSFKHWRPSIKFPFELVANDNTKLRLKLNGWYHIIYTDNCKYGGQFQIYDNTNSVYAFVAPVVYHDKFEPFVINAVFNITIDENLVPYVEIIMRIVKLLPNNSDPQLDGTCDSTFYIKYLSP